VPPKISSLIGSAEKGDHAAVDALFSALYSELHRLARSQLRKSGATIGATTLLHEAYLDISRRESAVFLDRGRFMSYAAKVMRGLIIDYARKRHALKRGGAFELTALPTDIGSGAGEDEELAELGTALDELGREEPALAEIVDLKFFCGFTLEEIAGMRGSTERTVRRQWQKARLFLHEAMPRSAP
jgi:RNA polymerase sigma factor (TIGR02999 family)